ncbi:MAG: PAS-domain containing protein [Rhodobacter sp.]|uniref:hybrid sensor histidine kinase/response regulator n=1 Tax=Pararhodobacter sp. TaxID=2127056 RepID=UPI001DB2B795|nr:PAS-domain containing protein [Pararhodobacter sp.]MCB1345782.1 PAS-domain containing protein [Paracoccaceae bacterium]MCC0073969.1 PAS-domain containing protein [Rhodobacter sp.]HPD91321.1 PAS-domain containing protein [Pararhodobacter sp.]
MSAEDLVNPADPPGRQIAKLKAIAEVLMRRVERDTDLSEASYAQFERAALLEDQIRVRTRELGDALDLLHVSNAHLAAANREAEAARRNLTDAIETVREGFGLFDANDVLVLSNSRFGLQLQDIRPFLKPGLNFAGYVELVSRSGQLSLPQGVTAQDWALQRLRRHQDRSVVFTVALTGDRWLQVSEHRTRDGGTVILQTDITDILRAERAARGRLLDDQARVVRATLDHISQGVCIFDSDARLIGWNDRAAELLAIHRTRFRLGLAFDDLVEGMTEHLRAAGGLQARDLRDWVQRRIDRAPLRVTITRDADAILDMFVQEMPDGGFVISFTDVTSERRAIAALSRANETLEARVAARTLELGEALGRAERANATRARFVAAASHDLLQPLSAAKLFLASIEDAGLAPRAIEALDKTRSALESVETILDALLDISRLESGRLEVPLTPVPLAPLLARLTQEFAPLAAAKGLRLRLRAGSGVVLSDPTWLRRILQNLIGNALRYTRTGGVLIGVRKGAAGLRVEITDTGPGIPETEREAIFREFHRLNARASASEGMGLGLAIVERATALLGHVVTLDSRVGRGSRFVLHLGAAADAPAPHATTAEPTDPAALPPRDLIGLLVAADPDMRRALTHLLDGWGISVLDAPDPAEALALIDEIGLAPDFVLIDALPGGEEAGLALMQRLHARHGPLPARLLSATRAEPLRLKAARAGVPLLYKPVDTGLLKRFVAEAAR